MHSGKLPSFRPKTLDPTKSIAVYDINEINDADELSAASRDITKMPTGMEKDEENESHLQHAIVAMQLTTSGLDTKQSSDSVIPTPKVFVVDQEYYENIYKTIPEEVFTQANYLRLPARYYIETDKPDYDANEGDIEWLKTKQHISIDDFETIMYKLENASSESSICNPDYALNHCKYPETIVEAVYELWLTRRSKASESGCHSLIPRIKTECKKEGPGVSNPYVCFRRRAEKMQTRRNRKCDEEAYEKLLGPVGFALNKINSINACVFRREESKYAVIRDEKEIFNRRNEFDAESQKQFSRQYLSRAAIRQRNQVNSSSIDGDDSDSNQKMTDKMFKDEQLKKKRLRKRKQSGMYTDSENGHVTKNWIRQTAEEFNSNNFIGSRRDKTSNKKRPSENHENEGQFQFKRKRGCSYRAPIPFDSVQQDSSYKPPAGSLHKHPVSTNHGAYNQNSIFFATDVSSTFYPVHYTSKVTGKLVRQYVRRRLGRCGQIYIEPLDPSKLKKVGNYDGYNIHEGPSICLDTPSTSFKNKWRPPQFKDEKKQETDNKHLHQPPNYCRYDEDEEVRVWPTGNGYISSNAISTKCSPNSFSSSSPIKMSGEDAKPIVNGNLDKSVEMEMEFLDSDHPVS
uniref:Enhancer of polycomb-like protein n=1 Tax=Rhabditophanes sp. KR3021 TaxID=114890 RepID=A0AC35TMA3_9BILA